MVVSTVSFAVILGDLCMPPTLPSKKAAIKIPAEYPETSVEKYVGARSESFRRRRGRHKTYVELTEDIQAFYRHRRLPKSVVLDLEPPPLPEGEFVFKVKPLYARVLNYFALTFAPSPTIDAYGLSEEAKDFVKASALSSKQLRALQRSFQVRQLPFLKFKFAAYRRYFTFFSHIEGYGLNGPR